MTRIANKRIPELLTVHQLARRLDEDSRLVKALIDRKILVPDATLAQRNLLFDVGRIAEIRELVDQNILVA